MSMLDFDVAQKRLAQAAELKLQAEDCALQDAAGRVLALSVTATLDLPPADNSAMDGYAIRYSDYKSGNALPIQQRCFAGQEPEPLKPGKAIRLFTGSLMPQGADTVVMQEDCEEANDAVTIMNAPQQGAHVRKQGEDVATGRILVTAGTLLGAAEIALLASQGYAHVQVYPKLKVGILTTGDELVTPGEPVGPAQIYNSNGPMLAAQAAALGVNVVHTLHALDTQESLAQAFETLLRDCDLVLTVGGVSVGEKDLVKPAIEQAGGTLDLWKVAMKPGKPVALAHARGKPIVCLPGNPVSAFVVFSLLVSPLIRNMQGREQWLPPVQYGRLQTNTVFNEKREEFIRVQAHYGADGGITLSPFSQQGSGIISSLPWASGVARIPSNTRVSDGELVAYYPFSEWLG